jgi:hypothetical protein
MTTTFIKRILKTGVGESTPPTTSRFIRLFQLPTLLQQAARIILKREEGERKYISFTPSS